MALLLGGHDRQSIRMEPELRSVLCPAAERIFQRIPLLLRQAGRGSHPGAQSAFLPDKQRGGDDCGYLPQTWRQRALSADECHDDSQVSGRRPHTYWYISEKDWGERLETYKAEYTTAHGDEIVIFGEYGYD